MNQQPSILTGVPRAARYLCFSLRPDTEPETSLQAVQSLVMDEGMVVGLGEPLTAFWGVAVTGLRTFPALSGPGVQIPSNQHALWFWLRGDDQGELIHQSMQLAATLAVDFQLQHCVDAFKFGDADLGLDLTGYEDGTENPTDDDAIAAALINDDSPGMDGSSFVAVQQWVHDLESFFGYEQADQDYIIGRRKSDNTEISDAPESAHVKRTEQESFSPEAFVLRRSMPFADASGKGLMFVAFGKTLDAFEVQLRRMVGLEDGIPDALFRFSKPINGAYYWCPPLRDGRLDLRAVTLQGH